MPRSTTPPSPRRTSVPRWSRHRPRRAARDTYITSTASGPRAATSCAPTSARTAWAPRSTTRWRCTCSSASRTWDTSPRTFRRACAPRARRWRCLSSRSWNSRNFSTLWIPSPPSTASKARLPMTHDNLTAAWRALQARATETRAVPLRALRDADPNRATRFAREACGLYLDFSRQRIDDDGLHLLASLADAAGLRARIDAMWRGDAINTTENRAVLH